MAMFRMPVLSCKAFAPIATFSLCVVIEQRASRPMAVLQTPVETDLKALKPADTLLLVVPTQP
jgi:hypothetical protein